MKKVIIIGCESSHTNVFFDLLKSGAYPEIDIVGIYSDEIEAAKKLSKEYGVKVMWKFDELESCVDGVMVMARDGNKHFNFAMPYVKKGMTMFIDKPFTIDENEATLLIEKMKNAGVRVCGGSCCKYIDFIQSLKKEHLTGKDGQKTVGGYMRAPLYANNSFGGFFFYAPHLVEMICEVFGFYPKSIRAYENCGNVTAILRYNDFDITALFVEGSNTYFALRSSLNSVTASELYVTNEVYKANFDEFYRLLLGGKQFRNYNELIAPVFILKAIKQSLDSGEEIPIF